MFDRYNPMQNQYGIAGCQNSAGYSMQYQPQYLSQNQAGGQSLIRVTGIDGAKAYQMPPNSVVPLFDSDNDIMYIKSTDGAGFPTIKSFAFTAYEPQIKQNSNDFVTRAEFEELKGMIENAKQFVSESASTNQ